MANITNIRFIDIKAREAEATEALRNERERLEARKKAKGALTAADELELQRLTGLTAALSAGQPRAYVDPLFASTRFNLASKDSGLSPVVVNHDDDGVFNVSPEAGADGQITRAALILGLLQLKKAPLPKLKATTKDGILPDEADPNHAPFGEAFYQAIGRVSPRLNLAKRVLKLLAAAVDQAGDKTPAQVSTLDFASVFEKLVAQGVNADDPNLKRRVEDNLDRVQELGEERPLHEFDINLPDLEATTAFEVVADHCKLMGSFIFASAFEELRAFQVVDKIIEMSQRGELALTRGAAGTQLYNYWREAPNRMSESERQNFYAMTLGLPTGQPGVAVNSDFQDLWLRFVSSVSTLVRETRVDQLIRSGLPFAINQQQVKKAARDLAVNMSSRGYGMVFYAAADLQKQINEMIALLQDPELRSAFGARDMWGVIDQVAQTELGGARNSSKYRMLATSGAIITAWMAKHNDRLRDPTSPMIDLREVESPPARLSGQTAVSDPTDYDLVNACEMWLADSAFDDARVDQLSQPRESPQQTSRPIQIPSIARDLLEGAGLGLGMGLGMEPAYANGRNNGHGGSRYGAY